MLGVNRTMQDAEPAKPPNGTPSYPNKLSEQQKFASKEVSTIVTHEQLPLDLIDEACMESFPCSDPPCYTRAHA